MTVYMAILAYEKNWVHLIGFDLDISVLCMFVEMSNL